MEELEKQKRITKKLRIIEMRLIILLIIIFIIFIIGTVIVKNMENNDTSSNVNIEEHKKEVFNSQFNHYIGEGKNYITAKQCITAIKMNNQNKSDSGNHIINCNLNRITELEKDKKYTIDCKYDNNGYINYITITEEGEYLYEGRKN